MNPINVSTIHDKACSILKSQRRVEHISKLFTHMKNDEERVQFASELLEELKLLPASKIFEVNSKNSDESMKLRCQGNKQLKQGNLSGALSLYTESILHAPTPVLGFNNNSDFLSLAFANRAVVFLKMCKYSECIQDLDWALSYNYPRRLKYKIMERKAKCYEELGFGTVAHKYYMESITCLPFAEDLTPEKRRVVKLDLMKTAKKCSQDITPADPVDPLAEVPALSIGQHPHFPSASSTLNICYSDECGRFVQAAEDIQPGAVLLVEKPYASVLLPEFYRDHCAFCLRSTCAPLPCLHCTTVTFCSELCRSNAWKQFHRIECTLLPALIQLEVGKFGLLSTRILMLASYCGDELPELKERLERLTREEATLCKSDVGFDAQKLYRSNNYDAIYHLVGNTDKRSVGDLFGRSITAACILECLKIMTSYFLPNGTDEMYMVGGIILRHLQNLPCNAHEVSEYVRKEKKEGHNVSDSIEIGAASYATLSLLNHSCDPDVVRHSVAGNCVVLRALKPLRQGQQVLDNYGLHYAVHSSVSRRLALNKQYFFNCSCSACEQDWPIYNDLPSEHIRYICSNCRTLLGDRVCPDMICSKCDTLTNLMEVQEELLRSSKLFLQQLTSLLETGIVPDPDHLLKHLVLLDTRVRRPWKEYNDCQETLKQYFNSLGNYHLIR